MAEQQAAAASSSASLPRASSLLLLDGESSSWAVPGDEQLPALRNNDISGADDNAEHDDDGNAEQDAPGSRRRSSAPHRAANTPTTPLTLIDRIPAQLHPAVSLGMRRVSSCYFSVRSSEEETQSGEGEGGGGVGGANIPRADSVADLWSVWTTPTEEGVAVCVGDDDCDADGSSGTAVAAASSSSASAAELLYHDILMNVFVYLDAPSLRALSESSRALNFEVFYFLELQLQRALIPQSTAASASNTPPQPSQQPKDDPTLSSIAGVSILRRLAHQYDRPAAERLVQNFCDSNASLRQMPLSHSLAYLRQFFFQQQHRHTPGGGGGEEEGTHGGSSNNTATSNRTTMAYAAALLVTLLGTATAASSWAHGTNCSIGDDDYCTSSGLAVDLSPELLSTLLWRFFGAASVWRWGVLHQRKTTTASSSSSSEANTNDDTTTEGATTSYGLPALRMMMPPQATAMAEHALAYLAAQTSSSSFPSTSGAAPDGNHESTSATTTSSHNSSSSNNNSTRWPHDMLVRLAAAVHAAQPSQRTTTAGHFALPNPYAHSQEEAATMSMPGSTTSTTTMTTPASHPTGCLGAYSRVVQEATRCIAQQIKADRRQAFDALPAAQQQALATRFLEACSSNDTLDQVKTMVQQHGRDGDGSSIDVDGFYVAADGTETCALHTAAFHGAHKVVDFLCGGIDDESAESHGTYHNDGGLCDVNQRDANAWTALHFAAGSNSVQAAQCLVQHGADWTVEANNGYTAYQWAVRLKHYDVARTLKEWADHGRHAKGSSTSTSTMSWMPPRPLSAIASRFFDFVTVQSH